MPAKPSRRIGYAPVVAALSFIRYSLFAIRHSPFAIRHFLASSGSLRYFYHQDANFRVCSLTSKSGAVVERVEYDAYGEPRVFGGVASSGAEGAAPLAVSGVGNPYPHQGLRRDDESGLHENRYRSLHSRLGRFMQRDPLGYVDGMNLHEYVRSGPMFGLDGIGLQTCGEIAAQKIRVKTAKRLYDIARKDADNKEKRRNELGKEISRKLQDMLHLQDLANDLRNELAVTPVQTIGLCPLSPMFRNGGLLRFIGCRTRE